MNSEKVKEIKELLRCMNGEKACTDCYINEVAQEQETCCINVVADMTLELINELESENERLKIVVDIANERAYRKKFIDEWRKEYQKELDKQGNGHIAGYPDFDLVYKLYFEQKDRIAELEKENAKYKQKLTKNQWVQEIRKEALKQFAEKLKEKLWKKENSYTEFFSGENAVAVDIVDFENCLDETLKEFIDEHI